MGYDTSRWPMSASISAAIRQGGFTLIELMIAVGILSILVTLAVPSFNSMIANNRASSQANALLQLVTYTRSEAIRRNRIMTICRLDGTDCSAGNWAEGIVVFSDDDEDATVDSGEEVIQSLVPFAENLEITTSQTSLASLTFTPRGVGSQANTFVIKRPSMTTDPYERRVAISATGRPRIEQ